MHMHKKSGGIPRGKVMKSVCLVKAMLYYNTANDRTRICHAGLSSVINLN